MPAPDGSIYVTDCVNCGTAIRTTETETSCPGCGVLIRIEWQWKGETQGAGVKAA